jgi:5,6-dimethylbenzimidazole synthase
MDDFSREERDVLYRVIRDRRDVRSQFLDTPVPADVLGRILAAAHNAPSVGFMQPWDFLLIESRPVREIIFENFLRMRELADDYVDGRQTLYRSLKLEGIREAPLNICVTCDRTRSKGHRLGRHSDPNTDLYSTVCAIQNLWLAARAESLGVGWVSILDLAAVKDILKIPEHVDVVAYLCVGYVRAFGAHPILETAGWETRTPLRSLIHFDSWGNQDNERASELCQSAIMTRP